MASRNDPPIVQAVAVSEIRGADATPLLEAIPAEAVEYSPFATTEAVAADQRRASATADTRACRDGAGDAVRRANDIGRYEAERERALIADGNRHARVGNQYDARRTPQYREDAAYARKVAQEEENEDVGDRDIAYEDRDPYKVGLAILASTRIKQERASTRSASTRSRTTTAGSTRCVDKSRSRNSLLYLFLGGVDGARRGRGAPPTNRRRGTRGSSPGHSLVLAPYHGQEAPLTRTRRRGARMRLATLTRT